MPEAFGLRVITPIVPATDMKRTFRFFELLGFAIKPYGDGSQYAFLHMDGHYIHVRKAKANELSTNPGGIYLYVNDVDSFYGRVVANGIVPHNKPGNFEWKMREFSVSDPDGLLIRIGQNLA